MNTRRIEFSASTRQPSWLLICAVLCLLQITTSAFADKNPDIENPDFTKGGEIPKVANHDWNLGPTGARGWMYSEGLETSKARQIKITKIDKVSPADGVLRVGDVILGIGGKKFSFDPRPEFGKAITAAEAKNGKLVLTTWRGGKSKKLTLKLQKMGKYSSTAPFACPKSE